jgi:hypothetical protein
MAIPWFQIAKLVPEIVALSRELLQQTRKPGGSSAHELAARVAQLEDNERKQAELVATMAEQIAAMTEAGISLRRELFILRILTVISLLAAIVALVVAL